MQRLAWGYLLAGALTGSVAVVQQAQYLTSRGVDVTDFRLLFPLFIAALVMWPVGIGVILTSH